MEILLGILFFLMMVIPFVLWIGVPLAVGIYITVDSQKVLNENDKMMWLIFGLGSMFVSWFLSAISMLLGFALSFGLLGYYCYKYKSKTTGVVWFILSGVLVLITIAFVIFFIVALFMSAASGY